MSAETQQLRSDARRNREKILAAASELFAERGADLNVDEIARRAGVGHATVFRRFPTKEDLILAMVEERLDAVAAAVWEASEIEDPIEALREAMSALARRHTIDRGFFEVVGKETIGSPRLRDARARLMEPFAAVLRRAQKAGVVRPDLQPVDVLFLTSAVGQAQPCHFPFGELWRRYLGVVIDGMRPESATQLAPPPPTLADVEAIFEASCGD
ncbi:MAG: TetR/AcrR family transcriptional regulator [Thermoleophilia bacterium]